MIKGYVNSVLMTDELQEAIERDFKFIGYSMNENQELCVLYRLGNEVGRHKASSKQKKLKLNRVELADRWELDKLNDGLLRQAKLEYRKTEQSFSIRISTKWAVVKLLVNTSIDEHDRLVQKLTT